MEKKLTVIGAGKVGSVLARFFQKKGWEIQSVLSRTTESARTLASEFGTAESGISIESVSRAETVMLAVPDAVIPLLDGSCASLPDPPSIVFHTSGSERADALSRLRDRGTTVFSFHPMQTFPSRQLDPDACEGIGVGVEGGPEGVEFGLNLAQDLGWEAITIETGRKHLYHAACVCASNYITTLAAVSADMLTRASDLESPATTHILPMMRNAVEALKDTDPSAVLTGPVARGEERILRSHVRSIDRYQPEDLGLYIGLALATARLAHRAGKISDDEFDTLISMFTKSGQSS